MASARPPTQEEDKSAKIFEKKEIIELIGFKLSMVFLEKVLIVCK